MKKSILAVGILFISLVACKKESNKDSTNESKPFNQENFELKATCGSIQGAVDYDDLASATGTTGRLNELWQFCHQGGYPTCFPGTSPTFITQSFGICIPGILSPWSGPNVSLEEQNDIIDWVVEYAENNSPDCPSGGGTYLSSLKFYNWYEGPVTECDQSLVKATYYCCE